MTARLIQFEEVTHLDECRAPTFAAAHCATCGSTSQLRVEDGRFVCRDGFLCVQTLMEGAQR